MKKKTYTKLPTYGKEFLNISEIIKVVNCNSDIEVRQADIEVVENHREAYGESPYQVLKLSQNAVDAFDEVFEKWRK